jgi:alkylation response protein AidB-like acyl-CoA dehydrogenase
MVDPDEASEAPVRSGVRAWLEAVWDPQRPLAEWRELMADSGWGCPTWPVALFGRGLPPALGAVVTEEVGRAGAVGPATGIAMTLVAPTLLAHGSGELKRRLLRPILTGQDTWCQLFSEPGSGSDLAGLTTRAERDGDDWVVNGQKVWNSAAHRATYGMLLARTDWDVPKHRGITFFVVPMRQSGIEVRPLRQMNGHASFNDVFLSDVRVPGANVVGAPGDGWRAALTTLAHERTLSTGGRPRFPQANPGRTVREAAAEAAAFYETYAWYPQGAGRADLAPAQALDAGANRQPVVRQNLAALHTLERTRRWLGRRAAAGRASGRAPGPEESLGKLLSSHIARRSAQVHGEIAGAGALLSGPDSPAGGLVAEVLVSVPSQAIVGGTDEIQHNIIGERVLGAPEGTARRRRGPLPGRAPQLMR